MYTSPLLWSRNGAMGGGAERGDQGLWRKHGKVLGEVACLEWTSVRQSLKMKPNLKETDLESCGQRLLSVAEDLCSEPSQLQVYDSYLKWVILASKTWRAAIFEGLTEALVWSVCACVCVKTKTIFVCGWKHLKRETTIHSTDGFSPRDGWDSFCQHTHTHTHKAIMSHRYFTLLVVLSSISWQMGSAFF